MFKRMGKKQSVSVELHDYIFRLLVKESAENNRFTVFETPVPPGLMEHGELKDEHALFDLIKHTIDEWDMKRRPVRFFVPEQSVLMRPIDLPPDVEPASLEGYVQMEVGSSIHLPFENPVLGVHDADPLDGKAMLYAAPAQEVRRISALFDDASLEPEAAEVRMLANGRFLRHAGLLNNSSTVLVADWLLNGLSIGIYSGDELEFLRFQEMNVPLADWKAEQDNDGRVKFTYIGSDLDNRNQLIDQVLEIGRIINFYQFSLYKGEKAVEDIVLMGEHPELPFIREQLEEGGGQKVQIVDDQLIRRFFPNLHGSHAALAGLALKGEQ